MIRQIKQLASFWSHAGVVIHNYGLKPTKQHGNPLQPLPQPPKSQTPSRNDCGTANTNYDTLNLLKNSTNCLQFGPLENQIEEILTCKGIFVDKGFYFKHRKSLSEIPHSILLAV